MRNRVTDNCTAIVFDINGLSWLCPQNDQSLEGLLLLDGGQLVLRMPDCGQWRLPAMGGQRGLVGRRVRIDGVRERHDVVAVERMAPL